MNNEDFNELVHMFTAYFQNQKGYGHYSGSMLTLLVVNATVALMLAFCSHHRNHVILSFDPINIFPKQKKILESTFSLQLPLLPSYAHSSGSLSFKKF